MAIKISEKARAVLSAPTITILSQFLGEDPQGLLLVRASDGTTFVVEKVTQGRKDLLVSLKDGDGFKFDVRYVPAIETCYRVVKR